MNSQGTPPCEGLIDYIIGLSSDVERKRFERHMAACATCREEAANWREVWVYLSDDMELVDPPADLKEKVLTSLIEAPVHSENPPAALKNRNFTKIGIAAACAVVLSFVFLAGWLSAGVNSGGSNSLDQAAAAQGQPTSIETLYHLAAVKDSGKFEGRARAYGIACFVRSEQEERLVVYVFDSPATVGSETYQVWLWRNGQRRSGGTFTVGDTGIGMMTLPVTDKSTTVDAIGVTLEPDNSSTTPRGPKMFGSDPDYDPNKV
ncbi:anti-sigma factor [Cohnella yongneupensis]|uniref:Regulator of SigK n=1 Tax=Cohnella yongneupensis TaxID=425006 RepID=A0ABW0R9A3_9BACL